MLFNNLFEYKNISCSDDEIKATIAINKDHQVFEGHFPGMPILPGVCQVQALKEVLEQALNKSTALEQARDIKFLHMINPNEVGEIQCKITYNLTDENKYRVTGVLSFGEVECLKLRGTFCG